MCNFSTWALGKKFWVCKTISHLYSELESSLGDVGPFLKICLRKNKIISSLKDNQGH